MSRREPTRETVLAVLRDKAPRALHSSEIGAKLGAAKQDRERVVEVLDALVLEGFVQEMPGGRYRYDKRAVERGGRVAAAVGRAKTGNEVLGYLTMNPRAFGFVKPDEGGDDIFIAPPNLGGAMHGDRVRITTKKSAKGREGLVLGIVERGRTRIVGVLRKMNREMVIEPEDNRLGAYAIVRDELPPTAKEGLMVVGEIIRYAQNPDDVAEVRVIQTLGRPGVASVEIQAIKIRESIIEEFSDDTVTQAESFPAEVSEADKEGREDLRGIDLMTIDPEDARDHDDAVWAEKRADGSYRIIVAIADVSHYVRENTPIDVEALSRGCSIYLPDRAIPMLPHQLSSNLASLLPNKDRLTLAVEVELERNGNIRAYRYIEGVMRSCANLAYGSVALALGLTETGTRDPEAEKRKPLLGVLLEVSEILREKRMRRGSLDFDLPEPRVKLDPKTDEPTDVYRSRTDPGMKRAYQLIEDFMLLANEVVAADCTKRSIPTIYRVHGAPDATKMERFSQLVASLGHQLPEAALSNPLQLSSFIARLDGTPHASVVSYLLLRSMQQATYDITNIGHFGLAAPDYLHFTSPIRRYPDLAVHRVLRAIIHGEKDMKGLGEKLARWASESSRLERRAMEVEREAVDLYRALLMKDRVGDEFDATISSVTPRGFYAAADAPFVEIFVSTDSLGQDYWEVDDLGIRLIGAKTNVAFGMGDRVRVRIESVSIARHQILGTPLSHEPIAVALPAARPSARKAPEMRSKPGAGAPARRGAVSGFAARKERPRLAISGRKSVDRREDERDARGGGAGGGSSEGRSGERTTKYGSTLSRGKPAQGKPAFGKPAFGKPEKGKAGGKPSKGKKGKRK